MVAPAHKNGAFRIRRLTVSEHGFRYSTYQVVGYLSGQRVRKKFKSRDEALGELNRLEVRAANVDEIRAVNTRLSGDQLAEAEAAFHRLNGNSLGFAVEWFLSNYRPPVAAMAVEVAAEAFLRDREGNVCGHVLRDYRNALDLLARTFPGRSVHTIETAELETMMATRGKAKKSWNNLRGTLHAIFAFCAARQRGWVTANPAKPIRQHSIPRGLPQILTAAKVRELFTFLESYAGGPRSQHPRGYLVPYFALATFAGIRPSIRDGELRKLHELPDKARTLDLSLGVIRVTPEVAKTNALRQVTIQPNLKAWLERYPLSEFPLMVDNMDEHVHLVRRRFGLSHDVLRHTFVSMHVAKFKSLGATALEAGNSEAIIRRHYLNLVGEVEAADFWGIAPLI